MVHQETGVCKLSGRRFSVTKKQINISHQSRMAAACVSFSVANAFEERCVWFSVILSQMWHVSILNFISDLRMLCEERKISTLCFALSGNWRYLSLARLGLLKHVTVVKCDMECMSAGAFFCVLAWVKSTGMCIYSQSVPACNQFTVKKHLYMSWVSKDLWTFLTNIRKSKCFQ